MGLRIWLPLTRDLRNNGESDYQFTQKDTTIVNGGKIGKCYKFNGSSSRIYSNKDVSINGGNISLCLWFNKDIDSSTQGYLAALNNNQGYDDCTIALDTIGDDVVFMAGANMDLKTSYQKGVWNFAAVTYNGNKIVAYLNGEKIGEQNCSTVLNRQHLTIGARSSSINGGSDSIAFPFKGLINDVRLYDHCLSEAEVKEISKAKILHYNFESVYGNKNLINTSDTFHSYSDTFIRESQNNGGKVTTQSHDKDTYVFLNITERLIVNEFYTLSFNCSKIEEDSILPWSIDNRPSLGSINLKTGRNSITFKCDDAIAGKDWILFDDGTRTWGENQQNFTLSRFKLEKGKINTPYCPNATDPEYDSELANTVYDISGYENNGTQLNQQHILPTYSTNCIEGTLSTEWVTDKQYRIVLPEDINLPNCLSVSMWGYKDNWNVSVAERLIGRATNSSGWCIGDYGSENTIFGCYINGGYNTYYGFKQLSSGWHLFNITFDGNNLKYYIDGEECYSKHWDSEQQIVFRQGNSILIGGHNTSDYSFTGNIDDLRVYATALTTEDIKQLYKERAKVDNIGNMYCSELNEEERVVEYLESTGTQYIDTEYLANQNTKVELSFQYTQQSNLYNRIFGTRAGGANGNLFNIRTYGANQNFGTNGLYLEDCGDINTNRILLTYDNKKHILICDAIDKTIYYDGVLQQNDFTITRIVTGNLYLFTTNGVSTPDCANAKIYYCKIWDNNILVRDFLPIISTEDGHIGEPCLFDTVENKYYYNKGTGMFKTNLTDSNTNVNITDKGILNCRYLIEGNDPAKVLQDENIVKVNEIKEN